MGVRPAEVRKKLFLWCEVLVLVGLNLLQEGSVSNRLLCIANDTLQPALVLGSGSVPDGDEGGED